MNPILELNFWTRLLGMLTLEIICVVALAFLAQLLIHSAFWRRTIWQISFVCVLLLAGAELTGVGRGFSIWLAGKPVPERSVSVRIVPLDEQFVPSSMDFEIPEPVFIPQKETPVTRSVWWPGILWTVGLGLIVARILFARFLFFILRWRKGRVNDFALLKRVSELAKHLGITRLIRLLESSGLTSPVAFGIIRPSIGLPTGFAQNFTVAQQNAMLTHELAHLAARDPFWYLLADCAAAIFWWHPAIWFARRRLHSASEHAADEAAAILENGPDTLAECLVNLGQQLSRRRSFGWLGIEGNGFHSHLGQRVERLLNLKETKPNKLRGWPLFFAKTAATIFFGGLIVFTSGWIQNGKEQREKNLATAVQKSWNGSFASMTLAALTEEGANLIAKDERKNIEPLSAADDKTNAKIAAATLVQDGKLLFEMGKLEAAEIKLNEALKIDAENKAALYYKSLIKEAQQARLQQKPKGELIRPTIPPTRPDKIVVDAPHSQPPDNSAARRDLVYTAKGRQAIKAKLDRIRLSKVQFEFLPLHEVLKELRDASKEGDTEHVGINFVFNPQSNQKNPLAPQTDDPNRAIVTPAPSTSVNAPVDLEKIIIRINPALENVRLTDVLDAVVKAASEPIEYRIEDYAVIFSPKATNGLALYTHVFKLNPNTFQETLEFIDGFGSQTTHPSNGSRTNLQANVNLKVREFFTAAGVDFGPVGSTSGKSVFFNDRTGLLMVRATMEDLEIIQTALESINHNDAVIFSGTSNEGDLQTRVFKVNPRTFSESLGGDSSENIGSKIRDFFDSVGVIFGIPGQPNGKSVWYKDKLGWLMIRATPDDLEKIEKALAPFPPEAQSQRK